MRADLRRTVPHLRDLSQPRHQAAAAPTACSQVPVPVPLHGSPGFRLPACPHSNLVSLFDPDLSQRPGVAGTPDGCSRSGLPASRQLLSLDRRLVDGATADESATQSRLACVTRRHRSDPEPYSRSDLSSSSDYLLLVDLSERVGH